MTKLVFPSNGIYPICKNSIQGCARDLFNAIENCNYTIPSGFPHENYLRGLSGELNGYRTEVKNIGAKLKRTDRNFDNLSDNLTTNASKITTTKITKRDRMIT